MSQITREAVLQALVDHIGERQGVSGRELVLEIATPLFAVPGDERRLRKVIEQLRHEGHHICGWPESGYFLAADEAELNKTCLFLHDRAMTSLNQVAAMKRVSLPDLKGQLRLQT